MTVVNFSTYTEVDPNSRIVVTPTRVTWTKIARNEDAYVYKDEGVDYFSGDFTIKLTVRATGYEGGNTARVSICALANVVDDYIGIRDAGGDELVVRIHVNPPQHQIVPIEVVAGVEYNGTGVVLPADTDYFLTIVRDESVGTYGTLYCYVYSDAARTVLVGTITRTLHAKKDFRYIYAVQSWNSPSAGVTHSGYVENLERYLTLLPAAPTVTTDPATSVGQTTATLNGTLDDDGGESCDVRFEYGETTDYGKTTATQSKTTGETFSQEVRGLKAGTVYHFRAKATNSAGTAYGADRTFHTPALTAAAHEALGKSHPLGRAEV